MAFYTLVASPVVNSGVVKGWISLQDRLRMRKKCSRLWGLHMDDLVIVRSRTHKVSYSCNLTVINQNILNLKFFIFVFIASVSIHYCILNLNMFKFCIGEVLSLSQEWGFHLPH